MDQSDPGRRRVASRSEASTRSADAQKHAEYVFAGGVVSAGRFCRQAAAKEVAALHTQVKELQSALRLRDGDARRSLSRAEAERAAGDGVPARRALPRCATG